MRPIAATFFTAPLVLGAVTAAFAAPPPPAAMPAPPSAPVAAAPPSGDAAPEDADEDDGVGLNIELAFATAYVFRGLNLFQESSQLDPHMLLAPAISWSIGDSGVTVGYWAGYQVTGRTIGDNVDAGVGAEQDLYLSYELELPHDMTLALSFQSYFFPAADPLVAEATMPTYLEPAVAFSYATAVDLGLAVSYLAGVQSAPSISDYRYLYLNPSVGKSFDLGDEVGLELLAGYGFKLFRSGNEGRDNTHDVLLSATVPIHPGGGSAYVSPGLAAAWTNIGDAVDEETGDVLEQRSVGDGLVVWGSLAAGMDL